MTTRPMVHIITGDRDSGKTMTIRALYETLQKGDGIISEKSFRDGVLQGYDLVHLSTGNREPLALKRPLLPPEWDEADAWGAYSFSRHAFPFAEAVMETVLKTEEGPLFIDEVGALELKGGGFHGILRRALASKGDLFFTARARRLPRILGCFHIAGYRAITPAVPGGERNSCP